MKRLHILLVLSMGLSSPVMADIWKWVDADGITHFVNTDTPIYTWLDDSGKRHYSDTPDHEDAVSVELIWHSEGSLEEQESGGGGKESAGEDSGHESGGYAYPGETAEQRAEREAAEAYYCKRATEVYDSYVNAPRLYRNDEAGEREYLSEAEAEATIAQMKLKMEQLCR